MRRFITIGEFDPAARSGVVLDRETLNGFGHDAATLVDTVKLGPTETSALNEETVAAQLRQFASGATNFGIKTGRLSRRANIEVVASHFEDEDISASDFIVDACVDAGPNDPLLKSSALSIFRIRLLPLATLVIAYQSEAARLASIEVNDITSMKEAAEAIHVYGPKAVLVRSDGVVDDEHIDILYDGVGHQFLFRKELLADPRATRDLFASSVLAYLSQGLALMEAIDLAQKFEAQHGIPVRSQERPA